MDALVVEDDAAHSAMVLAVLESIGLWTHAAPTAQEGLRAALRLRPSIIITDIQLPDESGFELCRRVRQAPELRDTLIVMITGTYQRDEDRQRAQRLGADAYLLKPYPLRELLRTVRGLLSRGQGGS